MAQWEPPSWAVPTTSSTKPEVNRAAKPLGLIQSEQTSLVTAQTYLNRFSKVALAALDKYETTADQIIQKPIGIVYT